LDEKFRRLFPLFPRADTKMARFPEADAPDRGSDTPARK
jgi:hypothetical protein